MALFDQPEEEADNDKNRLFETQQRTGKSIRDYVKFLTPIVIIVIVGIGATFYFSLPSVGDRVRPSQDLYDAVYDHMLIEKKRTVSDMDFYYCNSFYTASIDVEPKPVAPTKPEDLSLRFKAIARRGDDGKWQIAATALQTKDKFVPCQQ
jgi:hypothetical protein